MVVFSSQLTSFGWHESKLEGRRHTSCFEYKRVKLLLFLTLLHTSSSFSSLLYYILHILLLLYSTTYSILFFFFTLLLLHNLRHLCITFGWSVCHNFPKWRCCPIPCYIYHILFVCYFSGRESDAMFRSAVLDCRLSWVKYRDQLTH